MGLLDTLRQLLIGRATGVAAVELAEVERFFAVLVLGPAVGVPTLPPAISLALMPDMESELLDLLQATPMFSDKLGSLAGLMDIA